MVGVAGRSKGCHTCRKRKVKCDELKPTCFRCTRGGFECLGYKRKTSWRHTTFDDSHRPPKDLGTDSSKRLYFLNWQMTRAGTPQVELDLGAFQSDFCFAHLFDNFVWASMGVGWMSDAATGTLGALPLETMRALSQTHLGRLENVADLMLKGATQHGLVLRTVANALGTTAGTSREELLFSVFILTLYALYYPYRQWEAFLQRSQGAEEEHLWGEILETDRAAVASHVSGMTKLTYFYGPEAFQTQRMRALFDCIRMVLAVSSLYNRKRVSLEEHHWLSDPWAVANSPRTEQSKLMDVFVVLPGLLEDYEAMMPLQANDSHEELFVEPMLYLSQDLRDELSNRIATQIQILFRWRWEWHRQYGGGVTMEPQDETRASGFASLGYNRLKFDYLTNSVVRATDITLYNAFLIWLFALLWKVEQQMPKVRAVITECANLAKLAVYTAGLGQETGAGGTAYDTPTPEPLSLPGDSIGLRSLAMEICRTYEWQSRHHHLASKSTEPILMYIYPLGMATVILQGDDDVQEWITEMVSSSPVTSGYKASRFRMFVLSRFVTEEMMDPELSHCALDPSLIADCSDDGLHDTGPQDQYAGSDLALTEVQDYGSSFKLDGGLALKL